MMILKSTQHADDAKAFVDYVLRQKVRRWWPTPG
jgi:ABC-type Fe3+ transport system substrate-binding protein